MLVAGEEPTWGENNMMAEDDSGEEETVLEPHVQVEQTSVGKSKPGDLLVLMSRFLESPGNVLLIQGALLRNCTDTSPGFMKCSIPCLEKRQREAGRC